MTELRIDLTQREVNLLLNTLSKQCANIGRRKNQEASVRAIEIMELQNIQNRIVKAETKAKLGLEE